ncbi:FHA domain-containing protein [Prosthecobacter sp.]|uniref:FHA domain-containing protein n=1 Tax=Prosthecobacter sp. TaxID=1965333 RepID=UPI001DD1E523|nr:FHA domain-containing protein [Prosthecobacter sp.]MCB1279281.1 FHA domain-containing protein [Prosthecobacter sp.]
MRPAAYRIRRVFPLLALLSTAAALTSDSWGQEVRVSASDLKIEGVDGKKKIRVSLRLADAATVSVAAAKLQTVSGETVLPVTWKAFDSLQPANCAWLVVVDNSNPARQRTIAACADETRTFLKLLPKGDAVMIASLARDLVVVAPFGSTSSQQEAALAGMKADGDASLTTLIFQNVKHALGDHLARRDETRRCVVLLTDGKDETPGGPLRVTERRNELIAEAKRLGVAVHTLGFAEKATEANYFADLKELSVQTDGVHLPADVTSRRLPDDTWPTLIGAMHSGGTAVLDVSSLIEAAPVKLELTSESGRKASVAIPSDVVERVLHVDPPPALALQSTEPQSEDMSPMMPLWGWGVVGVVLLAVIALASRRNKTGTVVDTNKRASPVREEPVAAPKKPTPQPSASVVENTSVPPAYLELVDGKKTRHTVMAKGVKIGSGKHNDIVLKDDSVSETHCLITMTNGEWTIADLESANGLRVNGTYYHQASLNPGDEIELGEVKMRFVAE